MIKKLSDKNRVEKKRNNNIRNTKRISPERWNNLNINMIEETAEDK